MTDNNRRRFELDTFHRNVSEDDLIADLKKVARDLGKETITFRDYNANGKYHSTTITRRIGSWLGALEKSGLKKTGNYNIPKDNLFKNIVDVWAKLGRQPKFRELTPDVSSYSATTYASRFGGWRNALMEFVAWANDQNAPVEGADQQADLRTRKTPRSVNWRLRAQVLMRDGATCRLCGATPTSGAKLHVDHVHPWSKGGETILGNLQVLCEQCNVGKSDLAGFPFRKESNDLA